MMIPIYMHSFDSKESIISEFGIDSSELKDAEVLLAYW